MLKGGLIGCGFFAQNHLHAWKDVEGAELVAVCDADESRAREAARTFAVKSFYTEAEEMLGAERLDFVDVVTQPASHRPLVELVARHKVHVICQKPMAPSLEDARAMVEACERAGVQFMVHENFRWQAPMRALKEASAEIGELFFGRITWRSAADVYASQPYLATDPRFIVYDLGVHLLDLARFFLGEVAELYCLIERVNPRIKAEDVATILLKMASGASCVVELSFASRLEEELFPQTLVHLEGAGGSALLGPHFHLTQRAGDRVTRRVASPRPLAWGASGREAIQESVLALQEHWVESLGAKREPETSGRDNLRTLELVFGAYESARSGMPYRPQPVARGQDQED